ncbi:MAG: cysteine desulfurase family protein [Planctomycetota bacterium]
MIYLDNHATTPCDERVVARMLPWLTQQFGNPHSTAHSMGRDAGEAISNALARLAAAVGVDQQHVVITSGATESNHLAIEGVCCHPRQKKRHLITTTIEHPAVLDVVDRLKKAGFRISLIPVHPAGHARCGQVDLQQLGATLDDDTALVSVHWANNEIGVIQPMDEIASLVHERGALLHSDATQAVGRIDVDLSRHDVDLVSASAHKCYGPKGVGFLTIGGGTSTRRIRIKPQFVGGGQQRRLRSGTMSPANVVACSEAVAIAINEHKETADRVRGLRERLWSGLREQIDGLQINGPNFDADRDSESTRLPGNLNLMLPAIEGEAWMAATPEVAFSSGSACSSVDPAPSHVLLGINRTESEARRSVRLGIGKFNTALEIDRATELLVDSYFKLTGASSSKV